MRDSDRQRKLHSLRNSGLYRESSSGQGLICTSECMDLSQRDRQIAGRYIDQWAPTIELTESVQQWPLADISCYKGKSWINRKAVLWDLPLPTSVSLAEHLGWGRKRRCQSIREIAAGFCYALVCFRDGVCQEVELWLMLFKGSTMAQGWKQRENRRRLL